MTGLEIVAVVLLVSFFGHKVCRTPRQREFAHMAYVLVGVMIGPFSTDESAHAMFLFGNIGLLLILFELGNAFDFPTHATKTLTVTGIWTCTQYICTFCAGLAAGFTSGECLILSAPLAGASRRLIFGGRKRFEKLTPSARPSIYHVTAGLELSALAVLIAASAGFLETLSLWTAPKILLIVVIIYATRQFAIIETSDISRVSKTVVFSIRSLVTTIVAVAAFAEHLSLNGGIAAFLIGVALSEVTIRGRHLDSALEPISHGLFVPAFFVLVGMLLDIPALFEWLPW